MQLTTDPAEPPPAAGQRVRTPADPLVSARQGAARRAVRPRGQADVVGPDGHIATAEPLFSVGLGHKPARRGGGSGKAPPP
eukprot:5283269-Alexandrium_andersonii.AAC.1